MLYAYCSMLIRIKIMKYCMLEVGCVLEELAVYMGGENRIDELILVSWLIVVVCRMAKNLQYICMCSVAVDIVPICDKVRIGIA